MPQTFDVSLDGHVALVTGAARNLPAVIAREFAAAGAAVAPLAVDRSAHAAGSDVLKVGLIGCGGRGSGAAVNAMNAGKDVRLVAMGDVFADKAQAARGYHTGPCRNRHGQ